MANLFEEYENCLYKSIRPDPKMLFVLNRWFSNAPQNVELCCTIDRLHLRADKELLASMLNLGINRKVRFIKYIKKKKEDKELDECLCKYLDYSSRELEYQRPLLDLEELKPKMAVALGWSKKQCKKFGVDYETPKKKKLKKTSATGSKSLFGCAG